MSSLNFHLLLETMLMLKKSKLKNELYNLIQFINHLSLNNNNKNIYHDQLEYVNENFDRWIEEYKNTYILMNNILVSNLKQIKYNMKH
jgi:hypothetical protein